MSTAGNALSPSPAIPLTYVGASIALPSSGKAQNLLALIKALGGIYAGVAGEASELTIQCDPLVAVALLVCDATQAAAASPPTSYAYYLQPGSAKTYPNGADLSRIYVGSSTTTAAQANIEVNGSGGTLRW